VCSSDLHALETAADSTSLSPADSIGQTFENQSIHRWPDKSVLFQRTFIVALRTRVRVSCLPDSR